MIKKFITNNRSYEKFNPIGVVLHETATPGATDESSQKYFSGTYVAANAHCFVDWDSVTQTVPWDEKGWHAGPSANTQYIGVEMCRPSEHDPVIFNQIWKNTIWTLAYIFGQVLNVWDINPNTLTDHKTMSEKYGETDHVDPIAYLAEYGLTMDDVRSAVKKCMTESVVDDIPILQQPEQPKINKQALYDALETLRSLLDTMPG